MTPEREAQMREMFEALASEWGWDLRRETNDPNEYLLMSTAAAWGGFLACARALEPVARDGERYRFLRDEMELSVRDVFSSWCPQLNDGLDAAIDSAMSAALEDGNATE